MTHDTEAASAPSRQATQAYRQALLADAGQMYAPDVEREIRARAQAFPAKGAAQEPKAVEAFMHGFALTLSAVSVDFPRAHASLICTTNRLERLHKDIRRTQKDIGMFQRATGGEVVWYWMAMRETAKQQAACPGTG